jgi:hypothetical protein
MSQKPCFMSQSAHQRELAGCELRVLILLGHQVRVQRQRDHGAAVAHEHRHALHVVQELEAATRRSVINAAAKKLQGEGRAAAARAGDDEAAEAL